MSKLPVSRSLFACTLLGLSAILVATNPKEAAYAEHLSTQFYRQLEQNICREAGFLHASCLSLLNARKSDLISFIKAARLILIPKLELHYSKVAEPYAIVARLG
jgi:Domain of unknown function (DUF4359)